MHRTITFYPQTTEPRITQPTTVVAIVVVVVVVVVVMITQTDANCQKKELIFLWFDVVVVIS